MDNESGSFGLRDSIRAVIASRYWVAAGTLLAMVAGLAVSLSRPDVFSASAHVFLPVRSATFQAASGLRTDYVVPQASTFVELATSDAVLESALASSRLGTSQSGSWSLTAFHRAAQAVASESLLTLTVTTRDPSKAATLANAWAQAFTQEVNDLYAPYGPESGGLEGLEAAARQELERAEDEVVSYRADNSPELLADRRAALQKLLSSYIFAEQSLLTLEYDVRSLDKELAARPQGDAPSYEDYYQAASLFIRSAAGSSPLSGTSNAGAGMIGSQSGLESLIANSQRENTTIAGLRSYLDRVATQSRTASQAVGDSITAISASIQELDGQESRVSAEERQLELKRDLARDAYSSLAKRAHQENSSLQVLSRVALVTGQASVPVVPKGAGDVQTLLVTAALGFVLASGWGIARGWWKAGNTEPASSEDR